MSVVNELVTRSTTSLKLLLPKPHIEKFKDSFIYAGGAIWNSLDGAIQEATSVAAFKYQYKRRYWHNQDTGLTHLSAT